MFRIVVAMSNDLLLVFTKNYM